MSFYIKFLPGETLPIFDQCVPFPNKMRKRFASTVSVLLMPLICVNVCATDYYVSPNGGNISPFADWATAATNIQDAIDAASAGDIVWVTNGIYCTGGSFLGGMSNRI